MFDKKRPVVVVGAGTMGNGIAEALADYGKFNVKLVDVGDKEVTRGFNAIQKRLERLVARTQIIPPERDQILDRIETTTDLSVAADAQFVIEVVTEKLDIKEKVLRKLGQICSDDAVVCSNTSTFYASNLAEYYGRPEKFMIMHWMNPVPMMPIIELIRGEKTSDATWEFVKRLAAACGKDFVEASDKTGFIANTILFGMLKAAMFAYVNGNGDMTNIKKMMLGLNQPMCPLELADTIGLDVCLHILESLQAAYGGNGDDMDSFYAVPPILKKLVGTGNIGPKGKSRLGFYDHTVKPPVPRDLVIIGDEHI